MNDISWQDPIRKKLSQLKKGRQDRAEEVPDASFASQYLRHSQKVRGGSGTGGEGRQPFANQYLESGMPSAGPRPYAETAAPQAPHDPQAASGYGQPMPNNGYAGYPPNGYGHPSNGYPNPAQPFYGTGQPMSAPFLADGTGQKMRWNFLDLRNKKQTGDLYKTVLHFAKKNGAKAFCITSSRTGEGVSTIVANLAAYMSNQASGKKILVVDTNFQAPVLHHVFGITPNSLGLADILKRGANIQNVVQPVAAATYALPAGNVGSYRSYNVEPDDFSKFLAQCRQMFDFILVDCPPVLSSADALSVAPASDVTFLALRSVTVQRQVAQKAISLLQNNEAEIGGVILNRVQQVIPGWMYKLL